MSEAPLSTPTASNNNNNSHNNNDTLRIPGHGWTNGDLQPLLYPWTHEGKLHLYSRTRRWIGLSTSGWTRISAGAHEHDARHGASQSARVTVVDVTCAQSVAQEATVVRALVAQLCESMYHQGWATGTGGGVSVRVGGPSEDRPWRVFVAPSGIQKEDLIGEDMFELDMDRNVIVPPKTPHLRPSACTPLWYIVYQYRPHVTCVIHTHSMHAQMVTLLDKTETSKVLRLTHLEMLKGVGNHAYDDMLEIPIIDNRPTEDQLAAQLEAVIQEYPKCNAVLVRRHGLYVWGDSWEQAKTQCESFDYLFHSAVQMKCTMGVDPSVPPLHGTYRPDSHGDFVEPPRKRLRAIMDDGFHGDTAHGNASDLTSNTIPLLPRDAQVLVLDIEGCTTSIAFVHNVLFPYARTHMAAYVQEQYPTHSEDYTTLCEQLVRDIETAATQAGMDNPFLTVESSDTLRTSAIDLIYWLMDRDVKSATLKELQGHVWKKGFTTHALQGHVYSDLQPMLEWMQAHGVKVYIYSSGSVQAQQLHFGHSVHGNLLPYVSGHFDIPSAGPKKEAQSYRNLAQALQCDPAHMVFVSDAEAELVAAEQAQYQWPVMCVRPGNAPMTAVGREFPRIFSLLQLCGE
jgi:methylthioribulose 1-phosphate dehydratase / enolase-phosphatase E1